MGMTGLVHDIDWERIDGNMELHGKMVETFWRIWILTKPVYAVRA